MILATWGGVGFLPRAPGTWASLCAVGIFVLFSPSRVWGWLIACTAASALGVWASAIAERVFERADDGRIVIDEIAGQWIALLPLAALATPPLGEGAAMREGVFWGGAVTAFVAFRCFDIWKPGPIRRADSGAWVGKRGGVSVMLDDVLAGVAAALVVTAYLGLAGALGTM